MTQPQHPFTNLPEGAVVTFEENYWEIELGGPFVGVGLYDPNNGYWQARLWHPVSETTSSSGFTPNEAFQALRQAVRDLANDLGVV